MGRELLIGVDIGTQATKAALFDAEGACLAEAVRKSDLRRPAPGTVEEDPEVQLDSVCRTVRECLEKSGARPAAVAGLAIDGQMAGIIGIGSDGRAVTPYDSWLDTRCAPYIARMQQEAGREIIARTGGPPSFNHGPKILWWMHERPEIYRSIRAFVQPGGYAALRLCGLDASRAFLDTSYLHFSGFADARKAAWDPELCRLFGLAPDRLPEIVESHRVIGGLEPEMAGRCGLPAGVPVVAGCGDTAASFLSCGATEAGICVDVAGTASVFATTTTELRPDTEQAMLACGRSATPALWHPYAYINGGGLNVEWFRGLFASSGAPASFEDLEKLLDGHPPAGDDPLFIPHLGGRVCPGQPFLRGAWTDLSWSHGPAQLYRAVLEGVALEYGVYLLGLRRIYPGFRPVEIRVTGGGARSRSWNQIKADVLGIPAVPVNRPEGAPLGSALLAGFGVGLFADLRQAAAAWIGRGETVRPQPGQRERYDRRLERYLALLAALEPGAAQARSD